MDLLRLRDIVGVQISPNSKWIAFVVMQARYSTNDYQTGLFVVDRTSGALSRVGTAGPIPRNEGAGAVLDATPQWSPDSRYVFYLMGRPGARALWSWNRVSDYARRLTHSGQDIQDFEVSSDGKKVFFTVKVPTTAASRHDTAEHGIFYDGSYRFWEGKSLLQAQLDSGSPQKQTWVYDTISGTQRKISATSSELPAYWQKALAGRLARGEIQVPAVSPDGQKVAYRARVRDVTSSVDWPLFVQTRNDKKPTEITPGARFVREFWWNSDGSAIYFKEFEYDGLSSHIFESAFNGEKPRLLIQGKGLLSQLSTDRTGAILACVREDNVTPGRLAIIDLKTGDVHDLVDVNPEFQNIRLGRVIRLEFTSTYGQRGHANLVEPLGFTAGTRYPIVITTYAPGMGFERGAVGDEYPIQVMAAHGLAVLDFDDTEYSSVATGGFDAVMKNEDMMVARLNAAIAAVVRVGIGDGRRVGICGLSHGAQIALFAISHVQTPFTAAIVSGGAADDPFFYYLAGQTWWHTVFAGWGLAGWPEGPELVARWRTYGASLNAQHINAPLLINASDSEYLDTLQLWTSLKELHKPVEMFVYDNELHEKTEPKHRYEIYERNVDWFRFWLQDYEDPNPAKASQYNRWDLLRKLQSSAQL